MYQAPIDDVQRATEQERAQMPRVELAYPRLDRRQVTFKPKKPEPLTIEYEFPAPVEGRVLLIRLNFGIKGRAGRAAKVGPRQIAVVKCTAGNRGPRCHSPGQIRVP